MASLSKQETYRLLMKEKKAKRNAVPRIDHPLAKYNSVGQLTCVICTVTIKSELLWQTHLQSKTHKQNVIELKTLSDSKETLQKPRQTKTGPASVGNAVSSTDAEGFVKPTVPPSRKRRLSNTKEAEEDDEIKRRDKPKTEEESTRVAQVPPVTKTEGLPSDFFDAPTTSSSSDSSSVEVPVQETSKDKAKTETKETKESNGKDDSGNLPEGFFDNPVVDAKVRKVEYKDPLDEQWEAFQKSISKETDVSQAIIEVDDEEMNQVRELSEINEQVHWYQRAENLRVRQEVKVASKNVKTELDEEIKRNDVKYEEEEDDDAELLDLFDWRFKSSQ
ncbi:PREDICTED: zinc finger protein 830-like [Amphimedon queenslandica]|nr:PREDICTED: zinc finger protein 830-like [Amphimedon queenslandica]|eukprot:XP_011402561.1 PREDICTED: zinc finger protein 830-like [Amphimedon queenslandica]